MPWVKLVALKLRVYSAPDSVVGMLSCGISPLIKGYVVQSTGDGIFALFGAPVAHEDHPQRALVCGTAPAGGAETLRYATA